MSDSNNFMSDITSSSSSSSSSSDFPKHPKNDQFRIRVCMRRIYSEGDPRVRSYVTVKSDNLVGWLYRRIRSVLGIMCPFILRSRGYMLPILEKLTILRPDDPVEVFPLSNRSRTFIRKKRLTEEKPSTSLGSKSKVSLDITDGDEAEDGSQLPESENNSIQDNSVQDNSIEDITMIDDETGMEFTAIKVEDLNTLIKEGKMDEWIRHLPKDNNKVKKRKRVRSRNNKRKSSVSTVGGQEDTTTQSKGSVTRAPRVISALP